MKFVYPAIFSENEDGSYTVVFPDLKGCVTEGNDFPNALEMAVDAASGWILTSLEDGEDIPKASKFTDIKLTDKSEILNYVILDMDTYSEKFGSKAVRKNCTIPAWLNTKAEAANINFSAVLQQALQEKLFAEV